MVSPLTPALSPLSKGRGGATNVCGPGQRHRRAQRVSCVRTEEFNGAKDAAQAKQITRATNATPSPLNGERAGVRGVSTARLQVYADSPAPHGGEGRGEG